MWRFQTMVIAWELTKKAFSGRVTASTAEKEVDRFMKVYETTYNKVMELVAS